MVAGSTQIRRMRAKCSAVARRTCFKVTRCGQADQRTIVLSRTSTNMRTPHRDHEPEEREDIAIQLSESLAHSGETPTAAEGMSSRPPAVDDVGFRQFSSGSWTVLEVRSPSWMSAG